MPVVSLRRDADDRTFLDTPEGRVTIITDRRVTLHIEAPASIAVLRAEALVTHPPEPQQRQEDANGG